nr:16S rRNA pseudouridine(516) synthase [Helcococcus sueciensis]
MLNKPQGVISATKDYSKTVIDLLEEKYQNKDIFPVGRLDKDTEGFLLLTNDGKLAHELLSPKKKVNKKYFARVEKGLKKEDIQVFENGVYLDKENYLTKPAKLEILSDNEAYITIQEGKYHQVKRMFHAVDNSVIYLKRISMGELSLDENLKLGEYRELTDEEINLLKGE